MSYVKHSRRAHRCVLGSLSKRALDGTPHVPKRYVAVSSWGCRGEAESMPPVPSNSEQTRSRADIHAAAKARSLQASLRIQNPAATPSARSPSYTHTLTCHLKIGLLRAAAEIQPRTLRVPAHRRSRADSSVSFYKSATPYILLAVVLGTLQMSTTSCSNGDMHIGWRRHTWLSQNY